MMGEAHTAMGNDNRVLEADKLGQMVAWLDGQRLQDKEQIARLAQDVERIVGQLRELSAQMRVFDETIRSEQTKSVRVPVFEATIRQIKEDVAALQKHLDATGQSREQAIALLQADSARTQSTLIELAQALRSVEQKQESVASRLAYLTHELKNDQSAGVDAAKRVDGLGIRLDDLASRLQLLEEQVRRVVGQVAAVERDQESLRAEQAREAEWKRAADARFNRQAAEWQARAEEGQRTAEEQSHLIQQFSRQLQQGLADIQGIHQRFADAFQRIEEYGRDMRKIETAWTAEREEANRLRQAIDRLQGRLDEQSKAIKQFEEGARMAQDRLANLEIAGERLRERVDMLSGMVNQADQRQRSETSDLAEAQQKARAQFEEIRLQVIDLKRAMDEQLASARLAVSQLRRWEEESRARQIAELQRQLQDLRESEIKA
ncbi:MAG: hypothetical protein ACUVX1_08865 [Chloroflexota bacterium]